MHPWSFMFTSGSTAVIYPGLMADGPQALYPDPKCLAQHAVQALIEEAKLTPKPGLVDLRGSGSHHDLTLELFITSAHALEHYFQRIAEETQCERELSVLRETLGKLGRDAELQMLKATKGANTHRGAIWSLGLLVAGAAIRQQPNAILICLDAGRLARVPDVYNSTPQPRNREPWRTGVDFGPRSEAFNGFPHILSIAIPALQRARAMGVPESVARVDALLAIMATLPDTCILRRGGASALSIVQQGAKNIGDLGGTSTTDGSMALRKLEQIMLQLWVSPGGAADLLAATLFLDRLTSSGIQTRD